MKIKFQADADLRQAIVRAVRRANSAIDFQTAHQADITGLPDPEVLDFAAREGRVLVSHDRRTMPMHFAAFLATGKSSAGVILVSQDLPVAQAAEDLALIWEASDAEEYIDQLLSLPL